MFEKKVSKKDPTKYRAHPLNYVIGIILLIGLVTVFVVGIYDVTTLSETDMLVHGCWYATFGDGDSFEYMFWSSKDYTISNGKRIYGEIIYEQGTYETMAGLDKEEDILLLTPDEYEAYQLNFTTDSNPPGYWLNLYGVRFNKVECPQSLA